MKIEGKIPTQNYSKIHGILEWGTLEIRDRRNVPHSIVPRISASGRLRSCDNEGGSCAELSTFIPTLDCQPVISRLQSRESAINVEATDWCAVYQLTVDVDLCRFQTEHCLQISNDPHRR